MTDLIQLRSLRDQTFKEAEQLNEVAEKESRDLTPEEETKFADLMNQNAELKSKITRAERKEMLEKEKQDLADWAPRKVEAPAFIQNRSGKTLTDTTVNDAIRAWANPFEATAQSRFAAEQFGIDTSSKFLSVDQVNKRFNELVDERKLESKAVQTRSIATSGEGQYLAPIKLNEQIGYARRYYLPINDYCEVFETVGGAAYNWPMLDDTTQSGSNPAQLGAMTNDIGGTSNDPVIQNYYNGTESVAVGTFNSEVFSSDIQTVSLEQMQDSQMDIAAEIGKYLPVRIARNQAQRASAGTGTGTPLQSVGLQTCATVTMNLSSGNQFTSDLLEQWIDTMDKANQDSANVCLFVHQRTFGAMRRLKDLIGRPLYSFGQPLTTGWEKSPKVWSFLDMFPVLIDNNMADITSGSLATNVPVFLLANLNDFKYRRVKNSLLFQRYDEYYKPSYRAIGFSLEERGFYNLTTPQQNYPSVIALNSATS